MLSSIIGLVLQCSSFVNGSTAAFNSVFRADSTAAFNSMFRAGSPLMLGSEGGGSACLCRPPYPLFSGRGVESKGWRTETYISLSSYFSLMVMFNPACEMNCFEFYLCLLGSGSRHLFVVRSEF